MPSFGTVGALFSKHYHILEQLRRRIELLRKAKVSQVDYDRCWIQIEQILRVLEKGTHFLNFNHEPIVVKNLSPLPDPKQQQATAAAPEEEQKGKKPKQFYEDVTLTQDSREAKDLFPDLGLTPPLQDQADGPQPGTALSGVNPHELGKSHDSAGIVNPIPEDDGEG